MKMKKLAVIMALACLMFASPALAEVMYQSDYYNNGAVEMQYHQSQIPIQTYIQGADVVATDLFTASADLVVIQSLPQIQKMEGSANGGYATMNGSHQDNIQIQLNGSLAIADRYVSAYVYPVNYNYYNYGTFGAYADDYYYYEGNNEWEDGNRNYAVAVSLYAYKSIYDYINTFTTLPASGEMGATQTAMNQTVLQTPNMFLQMTQVASQGGFLNMTGHGNQNGNGYCD